METYSIKALRVNNEKSCQEMADFLGITKQAYSFKENGERQFTANELVQILKYFGVTDITKIRI